MVSLHVEVGFGACACGAGGSFEVAGGVGVESVGVFADACVGDSTVAEGDLPVGVTDLLEAAAVAEGSGFDRRILAGHAEDVGHHAYAAFV